MHNPLIKKLFNFCKKPFFYFTNPRGFGVLALVFLLGIISANIYTKQNVISVAVGSRSGMVAGMAHVSESAFKKDYSLSFNPKGANLEITGIANKPKDLSVFLDTPNKKDPQIVTKILFVDDANFSFEKAQVSLEKIKNSAVNAILSCPTNLFDKENGTCEKWEITSYKIHDSKNSVAFETTHFSAVAGAYLTILNVQSNLTKNDDWDIHFKTFGSADLDVIPIDDTHYGTEIAFKAFYCGDEQIPNAFDGAKIHIANYSCDGRESRLVNVATLGGPHHVEFHFGDSVEIAKNFACDSGSLATTCTVSTVQTAMTNGSTIVGAGSLVIASGGNISAARGNSFGIEMTGNITIQSGGSITGNLYATSTSFTIQTGGLLSADGKGNSQGTGSGGVAAYGAGVTNSFAGGGYGGEGGTTGTLAPQTGGVLNGSLTNPLDLGSGGGYYNGGLGSGGGTGGGRILIKLSDTLTLNGSISATGTPGIGDRSDVAGGGGSGGGVNITANVLNGSGTINVNGGTASTTMPQLAGGGGGGRIAVNYTTDTSSITYSANGGAGYSYGGAGTIYKKASGNTYGDLVLDNGSASLTSLVDVGLSSTTPSTLNSLVIRNKITLSGTTTATSLDVQSNTILTTKPNTNSKTNFLAFVLTGNATINGIIDLDGKGYTGTFGLGTGANVSSSDPGAGGGSHGGSGGQGGTGSGSGGAGAVGGTLYDSLTNPFDMGSGGGGNVANATNLRGGTGGGFFYLYTSGNLSLNGAINATGTPGGTATYGNGGGAGGAVNITANAISGSGSINTKGGAGNVGGLSTGGGAGGGRIALNYTTDSSSLTLSAYPGSGSVYGGAGTIYKKASSDSYGDLILDGGTSFSGDSALSSTTASMLKGVTVKNKVLLSGTTTAETLDIQSGATLSTPVNTSAKTNFLVFVLTGNATISGRVDVDGKGYTPTFGPGPGVTISSGPNGAGGGGHGGAGGQGSGPGGAGGAAYDSISNPFLMGSAGGSNTANGASITGGRGGGFFYLYTTGNLLLNGVISATGTGGGAAQYGNGGGAGGSVNVTADTVSGSGSIDASGGAGYVGGLSTGGGGGGGRIAVHYTTSTFSGTQTASYGTGNVNGGTGTIWAPPTSIITGPIASGYYSNLTSITGTASAPGSAVTAVAVSIKNNSTGLWWNGSTAFDASAETFNTGSGTTAWSYAISNSAWSTNTSYLIKSRATDGSFEIPSAGTTFTFDTTAPSSVIISPSNSSSTSTVTTISGTASDAFAGVSAVAISIKRLSDNKYYSATSSAFSTMQTYSTTTGTTAWTYSISNSVWTTETNYLIQSRANDSSTASNYETPAVGNTFFYDTTKPSSTINTICSTSGNSCTADGALASPQQAYQVHTISGTASDGSGTGLSQVEFSLKDVTSNLWYSATSSTFAFSTANFVVTTGTATWSYDLTTAPFVVDHSYLISTRATDLVTNVENPLTTKQFVFSNSPPTVSNVTASENSSGVVTVGYDVTDIESVSTVTSLFYSPGPTLNESLTSSDTTAITLSSTSLLPTSGTIMIDDEAISYTSISGNDLVGTITRGAITTTATTHTSGTLVWVKTVTVSGNAGTQTNGTGKSITWTAKTDANGVATTSTKIRIVANDGASSLMVGTDYSSLFTLDLKNPVVGTPTGGGTGININQNVLTSQSNDKASSTAVTAYFSASDDSSFQMKTSETADLSNVSYGSYDSSQNFTLSGSDGAKTVYAKFRDAYGNETSAYSDTITLDTTAPAVPSTPFIQDISNQGASVYRIFFNWSQNTGDSDWKKYEVWRSVDSGGFSLLQTISSSLTNYIIDTGLSLDSNYTYKVRSYDDAHNTSDYTSEKNATAGSNPVDSVDPEITNIATPLISSTQATITWSTSEVTTSSILYSKDPSSAFDSNQGVSGYTLEHSVTLSGLIPGSTYNYEVRSCDATNNCVTSEAGTFATIAGPVISNVTTSQIFNTQGSITWITDIPATSVVVYSENPDLSVPTTLIGSVSFETEHEVLLTGLTQGTRYYYYVKSVDSLNNESTDNNPINGVVTYYNFQTRLDMTGPVISNVLIPLVNDTGATLIWTTNEQSTSQVAWGITSSLGSTTTGETTDTTDHSIILTGLANATQYFFKVISTDLSGNESIDTNSDSLYSFTTHNPNDTTAPEISGIATSSITSVGATISWTTNEVGSSVVLYSSDTSYANTTSISGFDTAHTVSLSSLAVGTTFNFKVRSCDPSSNCSTSSPDTFTTASGPVISNVTTSSIFNTQATVTWTTDVSATSSITFSRSTNFSVSTTTSGTDTSSGTVHSATLSNLTNGVKYYYYVRSADTNGNLSIDRNTVDGVVLFYNLTTGTDTVGPEITSVQASLLSATGATLTWTTNEQSTTQVAWGTTSSLGSTTTGAVNTTGHSISLSGLANATQYFFKVISTDLSGNETIDSNGGGLYNFTTESPTTVRVTSHSTVTIDNRDLSTAYVKDVVVKDISSTEATVTWTTSKYTNEKITYGLDSSYGSYDGLMSVYGITHEVTLKELLPKTLYHFKINSADIYDNRTATGDLTFSTTDGPASGATKTSSSAFLKKMVEAFSASLSKALSSTETVDNEAAFIEAVKELAPKVIAPPVISGSDINVDVTDNTATVQWTTNKKSNSLVSFVGQEGFNPKNKNTTYQTTVGSADESTENHTVIIPNLEADTEYHFAVQSNSAFGEKNISDDRTFRTKALVTEISDVKFLSIKESEATVAWKTSLPTKSAVDVFDPLSGKKKTFTEDSYLRDHSLVLTDLRPASTLNLKINATDESNSLSTSNIIPFSTYVSPNPPEISGVRVATSLIPGKVEKVQAIITWKTDKPATSALVYGEGVSGASPSNATEEDQNLVTDHVYITTAFSAGKVYQFRAISTDGGGRTTSSTDYTMLTPRPKQTVIDVIMRNFEQTFGFLGGK